MAQAEPANSIELTKKGERAVAEQAAARSLAIEEKRAIQSIAEAEVERLLAILDRLDGDPDLEPSLGASAPGIPDDAEFDAGEQGEPDEDGEPSAGWTDHEVAYGRYFPQPCDEGEEDDPGEENGDLEPSLAGGLTHSSGRDVDLEADDCDLEDGHDAEQCPRLPEAYVKRLRARRGKPDWANVGDPLPSHVARAYVDEFGATRMGLLNK